MSTFFHNNSKLFQVHTLDIYTKYDHINCFTFSPNEKYAFMCYEYDGDTSKISMINMSNMNDDKNYFISSELASSFIFSANGEFAFISMGNIIHQFNVQTGKTKILQNWKNLSTSRT